MLPSNELLEALTVTAVCLREYHLPIQCLDALPALKKSRASSLCLYSLNQGPWEAELQSYGAHRSSFASLLEAHRGSLTQLSAPSQAVWECPPHILQGLTHLTIDDTGALSNPDLLFRHCTRLESLRITLRSVSSGSPEFYATIAANPAVLPHLTHLKLLLVTPLNVTVDALASFIRLKKKLRCLDYSDQCTTVEVLSPVLEDAIRSLSNLEILGLGLAFEVLGQEQLRLLRHTIPKGVTALRLWLEYDDLADEEDRSWAELWTGLPKLTFAHIDDDGTLPIITIEDLADVIPSLRLVGRCSRFHEVYCTDDGVTLGEHWSDTKVQFRTVEDFGCEDWEWLMRGSTLLDGYDCDFYEGDA